MHWTLTIPDSFSLSHMIRRSLNCGQFPLLQPPFSVSRSKERLNRVERLQSGHTVYLTLSQTPAGLVLQTDERLTGSDTEEISQKTRRMLRLGENLQPFLDIARHTPGLETALHNGAHILRGATLFEDVIKAIVLTQEEKTRQGQCITWIVDRFGDPLPSNPTRHAFPMPQQILLGKEELSKVFSSDIASKLIRVAERFHKEGKRIETLTEEKRSTDTLAAELAKLLGLESESLGLVMLNLGRYDYIPAQCIQQQTFSSDKKAKNMPHDTRAVFEPLQPWGGLACWLWDWSVVDNTDVSIPTGGVEWRA